MSQQSIHAARELPPAYAGATDEPSTEFVVWHGLDSTAWAATFVTGLHAEARIWTTREGVEALRDACNAALVEDEIARERASWGDGRHLQVVA